MKLSEKGVKKVSTNCKNVMVINSDEFFPPTILEGAEKLEFDQSDFTGAVVLTVEEAKRVQSALHELLRNSNDKNSREWLTYWMVNGRIEQAEMSKQST